MWILFFRFLLSKNSNDLPQWFIMCRSFLSMFVCCFANLSVSLECCRLLTGKLQLPLPVMLLNHFKTASIFHHCYQRCFNPIQDWKGGGGAKRHPYQIFLYNFCKRRNERPKFSDLWL